jgi:hypothetical protein
MPRRKPIHRKQYKTPEATQNAKTHTNTSNAIQDARSNTKMPKCKPTRQTQHTVQKTLNKNYKLTNSEKLHKTLLRQNAQNSPRQTHAQNQYTVRNTKILHLVKHKIRSPNRSAQCAPKTAR